MRITKRQLRRIIREAQTGVTKKYDDDSALVGGQSKLSDPLQKAIIDKTVEDREEAKEKEAKEKSESIRITKTQLRKIIREAIDVIDPDTGEVFLEFGEDGDYPDAAWPELQRRLNIQPRYDADGTTAYVGGDDRTRLEDETVGKRDDRAAADKAKRLQIDNLLARVDQWGADAAADFLADNPGEDIGGHAPDLARSIEHEFDNDEWNELVWHFDDMAWRSGGRAAGFGDVEDGTEALYDYVVGAIVG